MAFNPSSLRYSVSPNDPEGTLVALRHAAKETYERLWRSVTHLGVPESRAKAWAQAMMQQMHETYAREMNKHIPERSIAR